MRLEIPLPFFSLTCHYYIKQTWDPASEARIQLRASLQNLHLSCCVHFCYKTKILSSGRLSVFAWRNALTLCNLKKRRKFMSKSVLNLFPLMFSPCIIDCIILKRSPTVSLHPSFSRTCLTAIRAAHHLPFSLQRQRALITLVLRELPGSIQRHCSIPCNHSHSLMREGKVQTEKRKKRKPTFASVFIKVELYYRFVLWRPHIVETSLINTASGFFHI